MALVLAVLLLALAAAPAGAQTPQPPVPLPTYPGKFELIGHEPLDNRGMNSALAVYGGYAYIGSRTDGSHPDTVVMVVDVHNPAGPKIVGQIGYPDEAIPTQSSRELRVLPDQKLLLVLNHQCSELIHACVAISNTGVSVMDSTIKFYDIAGANAAAPKLVSTYVPSCQGPQLPHEFFIWSDPKRSGRVLMYSSCTGQDPDLTVTDLSQARAGKFPEIAKFTSDADDGLHSMTVQNDGRRLYMAHLQGGVLVADTSDFADDKPNPQVRQITGATDSPTWPGPGAHSAIKIPGRSGHLLITDEVYGKLGGVLAGHGCPWGWVHMVDDHDQAHPEVEAEYKLPVNDPAFCSQISPDRDNVGSLSSHNPTLTEHLAFIGWHGAGLQAIDISDPAHPKPAAGYMPDPLPYVEQEDPALSSGEDKVVMWSFPSIVDGLVYVVDLRNGLYILRYHGPFENEVAKTSFLDGSSNDGDLQLIEPVGGAAAGGGAGSGGGGGARPGAGPAVGGPAPCLVGPFGLRGATLGPFKLRAKTAAIRLAGGPPASVRNGVLSWCASGGGRVAVVTRHGRAAFVAVSSRRVRGAGRLTPGRRARGKLIVRRGHGVTRVALVRRGRVAWVGIASGRPSARALRKLAAAAF